MSREWKPGDVALVNDTTRPEVPWKVAMCTESAVRGICETRWRIDTGEVWGSVSQARPLVVIDPEDREAVERLLALLRAQDRAPETVDIMQAALREYANPKPPKPEEPQGLGAVVEDEDGYLYVRGYVNGESTHEWHVIDPASNKRMGWWKYDEIAAVRVLSPGVEVDQ